jgi:hypothetical protein
VSLSLAPAEPDFPKAAVRTPGSRPARSVEPEPELKREREPQLDPSPSNLSQQGRSTPPAAAEERAVEETGKRSGKRWENLPEWQRLAMQGAVMVVTATLVVAVSAWWTGTKPTPDIAETTEPKAIESEAAQGEAAQRTASPPPLFASANAAATNGNGPYSPPNTTSNGALNTGLANGQLTPDNAGANSAADRAARNYRSAPGGAGGGGAGGGLAGGGLAGGGLAGGVEANGYPTTGPTATLGGPQLTGPFGAGPNGRDGDGSAIGNSIDEDAPYTMAPARPTAYPSTSPRQYQYPTTSPEAGSGLDPARAGDGYPRVGDNLPSRPGAPR